MPARAQPFGPLSTVRYVANGVSFDMVCVPPGRFVDGEGQDKRELLVSRPFELGVSLVTQALWQAVMDTNPSRLSGLNRPIEQVSWDDAQVFLGRLSTLGFPGFRLPAEAEWAWAARCGVPTRWAGADRVKLVAVVSRGESMSTSSLAPSSTGAFDLSGNLWEWQQDRWLNLPTGGVDVRGPASGSYRVNRGGSWYDDPQYARVAIRSHGAPGARSYSLGVRLLRTAP